jgi:malonyl CoA-acyl carrier protein transacylase
MKTYMFPGQGSQAKGMGGSLFEEFKELTDLADSVLGYSIKQLCLEDPRDELNKTQFTQPAIFVVSALSYFKKIKETEQLPDFVIGHSLGEFNALMAAECFDFESGLKLVRKRGELMGQVSNGAMAAILNATKDEIEEILRVNETENVYLANYNSPSQFVISGLVDEITNAQKLFQQGQIRYYPLNTSGAFHSACMQEAMEKFREYIKEFEFKDQKIPVIANATARPYRNAFIIDTLASQITSMVRWSESIQYLLAIGASRNDAMEFEELGYGDVLTRLVDTIKRQTPNDVLDQLLQEELPDEKRQDEVPDKLADAAEPDKPADAAEKVIAWNQRYPVGTKVKSLITDDENLETRTEAVVLFGHRAAVYMKGYNGYFDLDEVSPR